MRFRRFIRRPATTAASTCRRERLVLPQRQHTIVCRWWIEMWFSSQPLSYSFLFFLIFLFRQLSSFLETGESVWKLSQSPDTVTVICNNKYQIIKDAGFLFLFPLGPHSSIEAQELSSTSLETLAAITGLLAIMENCCFYLALFSHLQPKTAKQPPQKKRLIAGAQTRCFEELEMTCP